MVSVLNYITRSTPYVQQYWHPHVDGEASRAEPLRSVTPVISTTDSPAVGSGHAYTSILA